MIRRFTAFMRKMQVPPPAKKGIPCALVGLGGYAEKVIIPTLLRTKQYNLLGVCSSDKKRIAKVQRMFRIPTGSVSLEEYLRDEKIKLIFITQRDSLHADTIKKVAEAKKHIFVEKPLALTPKECKDIERVVKKNKVHLTVGFNRRFSYFGKIIKEKIQNKTSPKLILYRFNLEREITKEKEWVLKESGYIKHTFGHFIDFTAWLLDAIPLEVHAKSLVSTHRGQKINSDVVATVTFSDGSLLTLVFTTSGHQQLGREIIEVCDAGRVMVLHDFKELHFYGYPDKDIVLPHADKGQYKQLEYFAKFLKGVQIPFLVTIRDGINTTVFSQAVLESLKRRRPILIGWKKVKE